MLTLSGDRLVDVGSALVLQVLRDLHSLPQWRKDLIVVLFKADPWGAHSVR